MRPVKAVIAVIASIFAACATTPDDHAAPKPEAGKLPEATRCDAGDQAACADLGLRYVRGDGVPADEARGQRLMEGACQANVARGCAHLAGRLVAAGQYERAYTLAERACVANDPVGCHHLAGLYERGLGGAAKNIARAHELYVKACDANIAQGCLAAASIEERGAHGQVDDPAAARHYRAACKAEIPAACPAAARLLAFGTGVTRDLAAARELADTACKASQSHGCATLALLQLESTPTDASALATLDKACADGHRAFCIDLAAFMKSGRIPGDEARQRTLLRQACDAGWKTACDRLAP